MRRGQAALEYLVTYGWAFLAILVVMGALAYFGFLQPDKYLPSRCDFGSQLECVDFLLQSGTPDTIQLQFRNNFGDNINITDIEPLECGTGTLSFETGIQDRDIVKGNVSTIYTMTYGGLDDCLFQGERQSIMLNITFQRDRADSPTHGVIGEIFSTVQ